MELARPIEGALRLRPPRDMPVGPMPVFIARRKKRAVFAALPV